MASISVDIGEPGQSARLVEVLKLDEHVVRIDIRSDSYVENSHARIERFDGAKWETVHFILPQSMKTERGGYSPKAGRFEYFAVDRERLIKVARQILGGAQ